MIFSRSHLDHDLATVLVTMATNVYVHQNLNEPACGYMLEKEQGHMLQGLHYINSPFEMIADD